MSARIVAAFAVLFTMLTSAPIAAPALAQSERQVVTTDDADYFGFDLRAEPDVSLDQCETVCLADPDCRAFTYNKKAQWCFLKSDYSALNPFDGAVAGKVVEVSGEADIGAPPALSFVPEHVTDEARRYRTAIDGAASDDSAGLVRMTAEAEQALEAGNARRAVDRFRAAVAIAPEDGALWTALARAAVAAASEGDRDSHSHQEAATSAAFTAYQLSRSAASRAEALAVLATALEARSMFRPAIDAYQASLELVNSPDIRADYADLRERKGFRVVEHTVDTESLSPRICVQFSEPLVKSGVDYASFVTLDGTSAGAVEASGSELCVDGLQHGKTYRLSLRAGLPAAVGEDLEAPVALSVYIRDRTPSARFTGDNFVLPATARRGIPVATVNTASVTMQLFRIGERALSQVLTGADFLRQLEGYSVSRIADDLGTPVWEGTLAVALELNREVVTSFPVDQALPQREPGVYVLTAIAEGERREGWDAVATQWFVVSDIGLATFAGEDGLHVFARALSDATPLEGVELQLIARNNEILGTAATDAAGRATFTAGLTRGTAGMAPAALMARRDETDFVFLDMTRAGFDLSDRGVTGRAAPGALDVFAWTERGIYRAGETVHAAALARDDAASAVENLPLTFLFRRPDGVEDRRLVSGGAEIGGHAVELPLTDNAMRGTWQIAIHTDPKAEPVANVQFLVEDFVPDRIEFDMTSDTEIVAPGETAEVRVEGRYLYGAPAAGLSLEGEIRISARREREGFRNYVFGLADEEAEEETRLPLDGLPVLDGDGKAVVEVRIGELPATTQLLNGEVVMRMREGGGRAVERSIDFMVEPQGAMIGVRADFEGNQVRENSAAGFSVIAVDPSGARQDLPRLTWSLVKIERNYQWYRQNSSWSYEPVEFTRRVADGMIDAAADREGRISVPVDWGRYRLEVESPTSAGAATSVEFDAGWHVETSSTETPDGLEIALDKQNYAPGETAKLQVSPRFAGELLVIVGADRLLEVHTARIPRDGATVDIPVGENWGAGAYVTATLFRPGQAQESRMPMRAIGVKWLSVDPGRRKLDVSLQPPASMGPRQTIEIPVSVAAVAGETAYVALAAVDVGILNLTGYKPPDPDAWYFGQRRLGLELRDLYGRLIDGSAGAGGRIRTGGDGGALTVQGSPPSEDLVAFFSGPVALGPDGNAVIRFDLPQFNGTVRVMAVAWTKTGVGHAAAEVIVRDRVVVTASLPKFLAPGDRAELRLGIANTDGPAGTYAVDLAASGGISIPQGAAPDTVELAKGQHLSLTVPIVGDRLGEAQVSVRLAHIEEPAVEQALNLPVRPATLPVATRTVVTLAANGGSLRVDRELLAASLLPGASVSLNVSRSSAFDVAGLLMGLDRYPHGCAEQITSRALPLLYLDELSANAGLDEDLDVRNHVQDAIHKVLSYQSSSGSFGLWSPGWGDLWLDAYVTDFLTRAREQRYAVPEQSMRLALDNLQNALAYDANIADNGRQIAYALYVLARNRKASAGDLRYYLDIQIERFDTPLARAQLAASLALYGDVQRAERGFGSAFRLAQGWDANLGRSDYGSRLRDGAAMLALAAETRPEPALVPDMVRLVSAERGVTGQMSTQEQAWMLLAARAVREGSSPIALEVDGAPHAGRLSRRVSGDELLASPITVTNRSSEPMEAAVTTVAAPVDPLPAGGDGYSVERTYYRLDGTEANVTEVVQNERFVVVLRMTESNSWVSRVVVTDLLPAGFEIDNPRIVASADLAGFGWLPNTEIAHSEFLTDRFTAAFNRMADDSRDFAVAYIVRAVTPGTYVHPAASVEDMYRPHLSARTATGVMAVKAAQQ
jgi:uncharacterized protein YfaS (alpha-2-macroglobulin family)